MPEKVIDDCHSWEELLGLIRASGERIRRGGGEGGIEKQHAKGRLTARERIARLVDPESDFFELGLFAALEMYQEWGGAPSAGVVTGVGRIEGSLFMVVANDATVKAGAFFPMTVKKVLRAQRIAMENRLPLIYLVDSGGVFLPLQEEIFPDQDDFGRIFRNNARLSAHGVSQIAAIMGPCVAGGAYLPVMCDKVLMTEGSGLYIAGPSLVKAAIGQQVDSETLGGASLHARLSGTVDFREESDESCLARIRKLASTMGKGPTAPFRRDSVREPLRLPEEIYDLMPVDPSAQYDVRDLFGCLLDAGEFNEYKAEYGRTLVCAYGRLGGWSVGIVANQKLQIRAPDKPYQVGGVIYPDSADKAARFVMDCNQNKVPLLFLHDVNGFMVGRDAEIDGIIRSGSKLVNVVSNSVVPKLTVLLGGSYGAGNYALCGKAYDPRFIFAWPTSRYAVMGGEQAARTLADLKIRRLRKEGRKIDEETHREILSTVRRQYAEKLDPRYAAARLWTDAVLEPHQTRQALITALEVVSLNPRVEEFKTGVLQV